MTTILSSEIETSLPCLLDRVSQGEEIIFTKNGVPVARLEPLPSAAKPDMKKVIQEIKEFRKGQSAEGPTIREMIEEGRR
jgi:prevent-host-death family protein